MRPATELAPAALEICVVGAGNLGQAQAGHLASLGHSVRLFNRSPGRIAALQASSGIELSGVLSGAQRLATLTTDLEAALAGASIVFVDVPATAHVSLAPALAPLLERLAPPERPLLVMHPGQTFGARHFAAELRRSGLESPPAICELQTALYTSRLVGAGRASVMAIKRKVSFAVYPRALAHVAEPLRRLYPQLIPAPSTLHTGLTNLQGIIHPAVCLFNLTRIDRGEPFRLYREGLSPALERLMEQADEERLKVAAALQARVPTAAQWFALSYGVQGRTAMEAMLRVPAYEDLMAPTDLSTRLLWEDVPTGLAPLLSLADRLNLEVPTLSALSAAAVAILGPDILADAWSLKKLGLLGASPAGLREAF